MTFRTAFAFLFAFALVANLFAKDKKAGDELFSGPVPVLKIQIPAEGMETLRQ